MEFVELAKTYLEIGVLGLCGIVIIAMVWLYFKRSRKKEERADENIGKRLDSLLNLVQSQNQQYQEQQSRNTEMLINSIINGVKKHDLTPEEDSRLTKISQEIDKHLQQILIKTNACRVCLVQYHNGIKSITGQSFLKMSITNEQVQIGIKPFMPEFKDQFRSVLAYFVKELNDKGYCYIDNYKDLSEIDTSMYEFLSSRGIQSKYGIALKNNSNTVIGFLCIEYIERENISTETVNEILLSKQKVIETLLNL